MDSLSILGKNVLVLKDRILGNTESQKTGNYVTGRADCSGRSRPEVKIDVWKYLQTIVMGLYAVCEEKLDNQHRALRPQIKHGGCHGVPDGSSWILDLRVPPSSTAFCFFFAGSHNLLPFSPLFD